MYLGIDMGTGTLKAALFDPEGGLVAAAEEAYGVPASTAAGADFDPALWWEVCQRVVRRVTHPRRGRVEAIGVAGQMHGVVLVDAHGRPVREAVLWPDHRAVSVLDEFGRFETRHPDVLGNPIVPGMAGPILAWLVHNEPARMREAASVLQPKDWLRMQLCGVKGVTDPSDASATLLYDIAADSWSETMAAAIGVEPALLPEIRRSTDVVGRLEPAAAEQLGLRADVSVVVGAGDAPAALVGAGIEAPGIALVNVGTGGQVMTPISTPANGQLGPGLHQYRSASPQAGWYAMAAVANVGLALGWVRSIVGVGWDEVYAAAGAALDSPAGDPVFFPFLSAERTPSHDGPAGGSWTGLTLRHDRAALVRSALRGVALYLGLRARSLFDLTNVSSAVMSGGSVRHAEWVETMATVLGMGVDVAEDSHFTVRGAARLAARGVGGDLPDPTIQRTVEPRPGVDAAARLGEFERTIERHFSTSV